MATVLIEISPRHKPLVASKQLPFFRDDIVYAYNAFLPSVAVSFSPLFTAAEFSSIARTLGFAATAKPTQLNLQQWLALFSDYALQRQAALETLVVGYEDIVERRHGKRTKLHRTRPDRR